MTDSKDNGHFPNRLSPDSPRRKSLLPFIQDVLWTGVSSGVTALSLVLVTAIAARLLVPDEFGAFALARQIAMTLVPLASLSMALALTRYVTLNPDRAGYVFAAVSLALGMSLILLLTGLKFAPILGLALFNAAGFEWLVRSMLVLIVGTTCFRLLYAIRRSSGHIHVANLWQMSITGLAPVIIALAVGPTGNAALLVACIGIASSICIVPVLRDAARDAQIATQSGALTPFRTMLSYGVPRVPGGLLRAGIFSVGYLLAPRIGGLNTVANLAIGFYAVRLAESLLAGFSNAALHRVSHALSTRGQEFVRDRSEDLLGFSIGIGLYVTGQLLIWADEIVTVWVGPGYEGAIPLVRGMSLAITPYVTYVFLRSVLDSIETQAVNTANLLVAFICVGGLSLWAVESGAGAPGIVASFVIGVSVLGTATVAYLVRRHDLQLRPAAIPQSIAVASSFGLLSYLTDHWVHDGLMHGRLAALTFIVVQLVLGVSLIVTLRFLNARWVDEFWQRLPRKITDTLARNRRRA